MLVGQILKEKAITQTVTIAPDKTIADAAEILSSKRIGAIIVQSGGAGYDGILSERDIVRELGKVGAEVLNLKVSDLMTQKLQVCAPDDTALAVLERMSTGRFRHMPVIDKGDLVGLVSIGDVVSARLAELAMENSALEGMIMGH
ncbi:CBS domain-containing protein [Pacificibacter maritimus]|uniref:CBS domain-containing protein n=1 Tax=Pacificibacter maritimus TaxID=762213 RepID=A0A3N4UL46_9RHOB|nr:CBS domain-containing protein [Pacificibacter maritimus]RPE71163.1 CBS domain-containing protein [Pacificibacter maritimus]